MYLTTIGVTGWLTSVVHSNTPNRGVFGSNKTLMMRSTNLDVSPFVTFELKKNRRPKRANFLRSFEMLV